MSCSNPWSISTNLQRISSSSKIMTPSTQAGRPKTGLNTMIMKSWYGLLNLQTLIPYNIYGLSSKEG
ncbi:hypothetical protein PAXRUDRAFT_792341, partial [Paxillus rubicundulus Ve08.2h10]